MIPWVGRYVGIPFVDAGRSMDGADCWGLLWLVYRNEFHVEIPSLSYEVSRNQRLDSPSFVGEFPSWEQVDTPHVGDVVFMLLNGGHDVHVGIYLEHGRMLHAFEGRDSCIERLGSPFWRSSVRGFYRRV
jgi:cell wall-associated NlpC family hydrolase